MIRRKKIIGAVLLIILFSGFITKDNDIYFEINKSIDIFGRVYKEVTLNYVDQLNPGEFMLAGINGMLESLDPYTNFIDGANQKDIDIITKGKYGGIGATVGIRNDEITIVDLIEGYSAQRQGMRIGDVIIKIDSVNITKENYQELSEYLKGNPGTPVAIVVKRDGTADNINFNLLREEIEIKNLAYFAFYPEKSNNAYLKLSGFSRSAGDEVKKALIELSKEREVKSIILDLRGNPGGLLDAAIDVCEKFLKKGDLIVSVKGRDSLSLKKYYSMEEPIVGDAKLILLIDESSASASEIVAGAMQDHDRAIIIGKNSFGKGLVQTLIPLSYNTSIKITTARYYTPSGRSIQKMDYSKSNKVFENHSTQSQSKFYTDNQREVLSAGGIIPDSIINDKSESFLIQRLLAEGLFFQFATYLYNSNPSDDFKKYSTEKLLSSFSEYLKKINFDFVSPAEKLINQLEAAATNENLDEKFIDELKMAKLQIDQSHSKELEKYKVEITASIKEELSARTNGKIGRITESLKNDIYLNIALSIAANERLYKKFVHTSK